MHEVNKVEPTRAKVDMGFTRNMGNFESLRIDIGLETSANEGEKAGELVNRVYSFVEKQLLERFTETETQLSEKGLGEEK